MQISVADSHSTRSQFHLQDNTAEKNRQVQQQELTPEEKKEVQALRKRDAEVRRHEQAHKAAAGQFARGAPRFEYEIGPDGKRYAVAGEVSIDTSDVPGDPEATIRKAQKIKRAALAPADPSAQDRRVAAEATHLEFEARQELSKEEEDNVQLYNSKGKGSPLPSAEVNIVNIFV